MAGQKPLILLVSESMDDNKKEDRNEHHLVRMAASTRTNMGFEDKVELWSAEGKSASARMKTALLLDIFHAFTKDVREVKRMIAAGQLQAEDIKRIGFVTSKTYKRITGKDPGTPSNIWISDSIAETVIGADPEFLIFRRSDSSIIHANNISGFTRDGKLGSDGAMAEVRPDPAITPENLVANISSIFSDHRLISSISEYKWAAECYYKTSIRDYPVGGHIHIGNPIQIAKLSMGDRKVFFKSFNKVIDELLALPMIKLDGEKGNKRRTQCRMGKYGYFGEMRLCNGRLEHRTLSGMWLSHPDLAVAVLGTAKAIIDEVFLRVSNKKFDLSYMMPEKFRKTDVWNSNFSSWEDIPLVKDMRCTKTSADMIALLNKSDNRSINKTFLRSWYTKMKSLSTYKQYSSYIDKLYAILNSPIKSIRGIDNELQANWLEGKQFSL